MISNHTDVEPNEKFNTVFMFVCILIPTVLASFSIYVYCRAKKETKLYSFSEIP